jgi:hypothetical protein
MPPKGWRRPRTLTADDYAISLRFMESVVQMANGLAQLHPNLPRMSVLLTIAEDAQKELAAAVAAARRHETADSHPDVTTPLSTPARTGVTAG